MLSNRRRPTTSSNPSSYHPGLLTAFRSIRRLLVLAIVTLGSLYTLHLLAQDFMKLSRPLFMSSMGKRDLGPSLSYNRTATLMVSLFHRCTRALPQSAICSRLLSADASNNAIERESEENEGNGGLEMIH